jgi:flagellar protein FliO/FliZ
MRLNRPHVVRELLSRNAATSLAQPDKAAAPVKQLLHRGRERQRVDPGSSVGSLALAAAPRPRFSSIRRWAGFSIGSGPMCLRLVGSASLLALLMLNPSALAATGPAASQDSDTVIYPHASVGKTVTATDQDGWNRAPWLFGALALAAGGTWWFWRSRTHAGTSARPSHKLAIEDTKSLGNRQYLVVAAYEGKKLLLGVTPGRIKLLCELSEEEDS